MALVLTVVAITIVGAGGGFAVADAGSPGAPPLQSDNETADDAATETEAPDTGTPEPTESDPETDAGEATATSEAAATATETVTATATPTSTPESADQVTTETEAETETGDATAEEAGSTETEAPASSENGTATSTETDAAADGELADCTEITEPGEYELTGDVEGSGTCIAVQSGGVVLDGNGHTVAGSGSGTGVQVAGDVSDVTVRNVDVSDWGVAVALGGSGAGGPTANLVEVRATGSDTGVRLVGADDSAMQAVTARSNGDGVVIADTAGVQASDVTVAGNDGTGLWLARGVSDSSFSVVQATDNGDEGIAVATGAVDNFVGDATVTDNGGPGVEFADSSNNVLADSRVERNGGPGVLSYPAGGDRLENVQLGDNGDGAYRDEAERAGAVADTVELGNGASVQFEQGVTRLAARDAPESVPEDTTVAGPAVDVTLRDGGSATVTVPVDASGDVTAYQRADGGWEEVSGVSASDGQAEIPVSGSGVVVPVVDTADAGTTGTEAGTPDSEAGTPGTGDDTVRADTSADGGTAPGDGAASGDSASSDAEANDGSAANDESAANEAPSQSDDAAAAGPGDSGGADSPTDERALDDGTADAEPSEPAVDRTADGVETVVIESAGDEAATDYTLLVDGNVSRVTEGEVTADANDSISRTNGTVVVDGTTATADAYLVEGQLHGVCGSVGTPGYSLRYGDVAGPDETSS